MVGSGQEPMAMEAISRVQSKVAGNARTELKEIDVAQGQALSTEKLTNAVIKL